MESSQQQDQTSTERRVMSRIDAALRINYQVITEESALKDPYDPDFVLPRYFLLLAELDQFDQVLNNELEQIKQQDQPVGQVLSLLNHKLDLLTGCLYDSIVQTMLPQPENVNISASGLSFYSKQPIPDDSYIHLTISHPENFFHLASIAQVVYSKQVDEQLYRTGAYFVTLHPHDRTKLAECIDSMVQYSESHT